MIDEKDLLLMIRAKERAYNEQAKSIGYINEDFWEYSSMASAMRSFYDDVCTYFKINDEQIN